MQTNAPRDQVTRTFQRLVAATETHFWHEEQRFLGTDYPGAARHVRQHGHLRKILLSFQRSMDTALPPEPLEKQLAFLRDWLLDHIVTEDQPMEAYLKANAPPCRD